MKIFKIRCCWAVYGKFVLVQKMHTSQYKIEACRSYHRSDSNEGSDNIAIFLLLICMFLGEHLKI